MKRKLKWVLIVVGWLIVLAINAPFAWHEMKRGATVVRHAWGCEP